MKRWAKNALLVLVLAATGVWGWRVLHPGSEKIIRKRLEEMARTASVEGNEGQIARLAKAQSLANYFTPDVEIAIDMPEYHVQTIEGRDELMQAAVAARSRGNALKIELVDVSVAIAPDGVSAEAHFTGKAKIASERSIQAQEIRARLVKMDGNWLIRRVETVRTLR
jgi:hypothetical protein